MTFDGPLTSCSYCFSVKATVDIGHMKKQMRNRAALGIGLFLQFIVLPFVGFLIGE